MNELFYGPGIVLLGLFLAAGYTIYTFIKTGHIERMAKIEKGIDTNTPSQRRYIELKLGMFMVGIAVGILLAYLGSESLNIPGGVLYPSFIFLFGGLSLIASYVWIIRARKK